MPIKEATERGTENSNDEVRSIFFQNCRAVFQGGGCRAAALAGAYEAATMCGVRFTEVAGTSAGSIVAALVGANASPNQVKDILSELDFTSFLGEPERKHGFSGWQMRFIGNLFRHCPTSIAKGIGKIISFGGLHSSTPIEKWIEKKLVTLLPEAKNPVRFCDLIIPTKIVATDLLASKAKVWGTKETPDESVAFAVRASCSIPFFFQEVEQGHNRFVDGGLLSNLPSFVYNLEGGAGQSFANRILAFRLREDIFRPDEWGPSEIAKKLLSAVIDGAAELQVSMTKNVCTIDIPTGKIRTTDFKIMNAKKVEELIELGKRATLAFFRDEARYVTREDLANHLCRDRDEAYFAFVEEAERPTKEVIVADYNSYWFWKLFPTVLHWRRSGTPVKVLITPAAGEPSELRREQYRRRILKGIGVNLEEVSEVPVGGYIFSRNDPSQNAAVIYCSTEDEFEPFAIRYSGKSHQAAIKSIRETMLKDRFIDEKIPPQPKLVPGNKEKLISLLKEGVAQYSHDQVTINYKEVSINQIDLITKYIRAYKYNQISRLKDAYENIGLELFMPAEIMLNDGSLSIVTPPVLEILGDKYVAIEGNTRIYYCWKNGIRKIKCLVVSNVREPLPGNPVSINKAQVSSIHLDPEVRMPDFNSNYFRRIEGATHPI